jgi:hypothetical protein
MALIVRTLCSGGGPVGVACGAFRSDPLAPCDDESACAGRAGDPPSPGPGFDAVIGYEGAIELVDTTSLGGDVPPGGGGGGGGGGRGGQFCCARCPRPAPDTRPPRLTCPADPAAPASTVARQRVRGGLIALATLSARRGGSGAPARDALLLLTGDGRLVAVAWSGAGPAALGSPAGGRFVEVGAVDLAGDAGDDEDSVDDDGSDGGCRASPGSPTPGGGGSLSPLAPRAG